MITVNTSYKFLSTLKISEGTFNKASLDLRKIIANVISTGASGVILTHNHPSGDIKPSNSDVIATNLVKRALATIDVKLLDHIVVGKDECFSMKSVDFLG
jgi:DNA repair protein RadC